MCSAKKQLEEKEQLARENLKQVQKFQKAYYVPWSAVPCRRPVVVKTEPGREEGNSSTPGAVLGGL